MKSRIHIAYLVNQYPKVSHSFIRREIQALERLGVKITRYAIRGWDAEIVDDADLMEQTKTRYVLKNGVLKLLGVALITAVSSPGRFFSALGTALGMAKHSDRSLPYFVIYLAHACQISRWLRGTDIQHIHAHFGTNSAQVTLLVRLLGGPTYSFTVHGPEEFDRGNQLSLDKTIASAKFVAAISSYTRSQLFRKLPLDQWSKVKIVHCGVDPEFHSGHTSPVPNTNQLLCIGRLNEQKGQLIALEALKLVLDEGVACNLVFAGDGEMRTALEQSAKQLGVSDHVRITGWVTSREVGELLIQSKCLVLPSFQEGLPVVIMEAMCMRRPVISTYIAGIPELVINNETGWLVPAGSVRKLADAIKTCLGSSDEEISRICELAANRVLERHSIDNEASRLLDSIEATHIPSAIEEWQSARKQF